MTAPHRYRTSTTVAAALPLAAGALTWPPARWGVMTTWDGTWLGLDYTAWNRLSLLPLALLSLGSLAASARAATRSATTGWAMNAAGFGLSFVGVALEFVVGGGLRGGPRDVAVAGWTTYLLGLAVVAVGSLVLAASLAGRDRPAAVAAASVGIAFLVWPVLLGTGQDSFAVADQLLVGLAWLVLAARLPVPEVRRISRGGGATPRRPTGRRVPR